MLEEGENQESKSSKFRWLKTAFWYLLLGSIGPFYVYKVFADPSYTNGKPDWFWWILPLGIWSIMGLLISGIVIAWTGGVTRQPDWEKRAEAAFALWLKLGGWLVAIAIGLLAVVWAFGAISNYLEKVDAGTRLIAGLLLMILFTLWGMAARIRKRD